MVYDIIGSSHWVVVEMVYGTIGSFIWGGYRGGVWHSHGVY